MNRPDVYVSHQIGKLHYLFILYTVFFSFFWQNSRGLFSRACDHLLYLHCIKFYSLAYLNLLWNQRIVHKSIGKKSKEKNNLSLALSYQNRFYLYPFASKFHNIIIKYLLNSKQYTFIGFTIYGLENVMEGESRTRS